MIGPRAAPNTANRTVLRGSYAGEGMWEGVSCEGSGGNVRLMLWGYMSKNWFLTMICDVCACR
jgi:hypothetical protein